AGGPVHPAKRVGPDGEDQVAGRAKEGLMYQELVITVLVKALHTGAVAPDSMHPRCGVACKLDPFGIERMKLRVNHGARKRNFAPARATHAAAGEAARRTLLKRSDQPLAIAADRGFAQLRSRPLDNAAVGQSGSIDSPKPAPSRDDELPAFGIE